MLEELTYTDFDPKSFSATREAFLRKTPLPSAAFDRLEADAKKAAFRIARVNAMRDVMAARAAIADAIDGRITLREAMLALQEKFAGGDFSRGTLSRLQFQIQQNVAAAQSAAREQALTHPAVAKEFPYWQYMTVGDGTPGKYGVRPAHAVLHGLVLRYDDPFWRVHKPPWEPG